jgi:ComF family protein
MWVRVTGATKEAFFPTRCLVCGSFFRNSGQENSSLKTFLQILSSREQGSLGLAGFFQQTDLKKDYVEACLGTDAKIFTELMSPFICANCSGTYMAVESPICSTCGVVFESREGEDHHCGECLDAPKRFRMARSAGVYDKVLMAVIHCLKYKEKIQLARPLGAFLFMIFGRYWNKENINLIMPIPLHNRKFRSRGFNTSFLFVKEWAFIAKALNGALPVIPVAKDVLVRKRWTEPQTGLGRKERLQNIKNAFGVSDSSKVKGKKILLVDDVYTTGATANECAKVLMREGAARVDVLTLARAM